MSATSARGYDWTAARTVDLWRWHAEDLDTADDFAATNNTAAVNDHLAMAAAKLEAIERKLAGFSGLTEAERNCPAFRPNRRLDTGVWRYPVLQYNVPDAERIYGSAYLARHPEMQEGT